MRHRISTAITFGRVFLLLAIILPLASGQGCLPTDNDQQNNDDDGDDNQRVLQAENVREAFKSQCALNVIECTSSWPEAIARVEAGPHQQVEQTDEGYHIFGQDSDGVELVRLIGSDSTAGNTATEITYSWSFGASDDDPRTLEPGEVFSTEADTEIRMAKGVHYIRLTVRNDIIRDQIVSPQYGVLFENEPSFDFVELEITVHD
jgi:hypothetical protein